MLNQIIVTASTESLNDLDRFCHSMPDILQNADFVRGVIFAVAAAPEIPMPQQWFSWVFKQHGQLTDGKQADALADSLIDELKQQLAKMRDLKDAAEYPISYLFPTDTQASNPLSQWLNGLLYGHQQLQLVWQQAWQQMQVKMVDDIHSNQKDLRHCLSMFSTFADLPLAIEQAKAKGNPELATQLPQIFRSLPLALASYINLSGKLVQYLPDQFEQFQK